MGDGISHNQSSVSASVVVMGGGSRSTWARSDRHVEISERAVQARLLVGAFFALTDDQGAADLIFARGKLLRAHARNDHAARGHAPAVLYGLRPRDVDDRGR